MTKSTIRTAATITAASAAAAIGLAVAAAPGHAQPATVTVPAAFHAPFLGRHAAGVTPPSTATATTVLRAAQTPVSRPTVPVPSAIQPATVQAAGRPYAAPSVVRAASAVLATTSTTSTTSTAADQPVYVQYSDGNCGQTSQSEAEANHLTVVTTCTPPAVAAAPTGTGPSGQPVAADPRVTVIFPDGTCGQTGQDEADANGLKTVPASTCPDQSITPRPTGLFGTTPLNRYAMTQMAVTGSRP